MNALSESQSDALINSLPHQEPMRLLHRIQSASANDATCETKLNEKVQRMFPVADAIDSCIGVELIAQSSAIPLIFERSDNEKVEGMLVQVKRFETFERTLPFNATVTTRVHFESKLQESFVMASGEIFLGEKLVGQGLVTLAMGAPS